LIKEETIVRIAAKGDGITESGQHYPGTVPGDRIANGAVISRGPHYVEAPCAHFERCGGCQIQHADEAALTDFVTQRVAGAARGQGIEPEEVLATHLSPPAARRRATLHALRTAKGAVLGFREAGSHRIVDATECPVLADDLTRLFPRLRAFLGRYAGKQPVDVMLASSDQGPDIAFTNLALEGLEATEAVLDLAREAGLARLSLDQGYGPETLWEPEPVTVTLSGTAVPLPVGAFLQATPDAQDVMVEDARNWLSETRMIADLFAGLGTFAFGLSGSARVLAAEADRAAHLACKAAANRTGKSVFPIHRDLFRNPLQPDELDRFDAVLLDPPRAGARSQIDQIAKSSVGRVVYVSCNPSSWSRDAAVLCSAGFKLRSLRPIGQFRWSTHVELTSLFER